MTDGWESRPYLSPCLTELTLSKNWCPECYICLLSWFYWILAILCELAGIQKSCWQSAGSEHYSTKVDVVRI